MLPPKPMVTDSMPKVIKSNSQGVEGVSCKSDADGCCAVEEASGDFGVEIRRVFHEHVRLHSQR